MSLPEASVNDYSERRKHLERIKRNTPIGIFGSFYPSRKQDLILLREFLGEAGYCARISEDLNTGREKESKKKDSLLDRELSERLIAESDIHLFVLVHSRKNEPDNLIQSVSMEIERLHTLDECGQKPAKYVAVFSETGLIGTMGSVCEGLLASKEGDWIIEEFSDIREILRPARQFCLNCVLDKSGL
jgi:hypothetical protein